MPKFKLSASDRISPEVRRFRDALDACSCAERDRDNKITNPQLRKEEEELDKSLPKFASEHAEEILQSAAPESVPKGEVTEASGRIAQLDPVVAAELLFAVLENPGSFSELTGSAFTESLGRLDSEVAAAHLYEVRLTQNAEALTDRRLFTNEAVSFLNAVGKEPASEIYNSVGRTGNVEAIGKMFSSDVLRVIGDDAKVASEISYALGATGSDAVLSEEVLDARKRMSSDLYSDVISAMWVTRRPEEFSKAGLLDRIGRGSVNVWEYAADLVSEKESKTVIMAKLGDDDHDRGAKFAMQSLADAGFRVVYLDRVETHKDVVDTALCFGASAIGFSFSADSQRQIATNVISAIEARDGRVSFFGGGALTPYAARSLEGAGLRLFQNSTAFDDAASFLSVPGARGIRLQTAMAPSAFGSYAFVEDYAPRSFGEIRMGASLLEIALGPGGERQTVKSERFGHALDTQAIEELQGIMIGPYGRMELGNGLIALNPTGVPIPLSKAVIILHASIAKKESSGSDYASNPIQKHAPTPPPLQYPKAAVSNAIIAHSSNPWQVMLMVHDVFPRETNEQMLSSLRRRADHTPIARSRHAAFSKSGLGVSIRTAARKVAEPSGPSAVLGSMQTNPMPGLKTSNFGNQRKGYKGAKPQFNQGEPMASVEAIRIPPEVKVPSKFELRQQLVDGKTEKESQRALTGIEKPLQSIRAEFAGSKQNGDISKIASEVLGLIEGPKVAVQVSKYYSEEGGKGAKSLADLSAAIQNHDLARMTDEPINEMLVENYMVRNKVEARKDALGALSAEGRRGQRVASMQERTPESPVAGFKDVKATEEARNEDLRKEMQLTADAYYDLAAVTAGTKLGKDLMLIFESKQIKPEQKWAQAESLLNEFKKNPAAYGTKWTRGGAGGAGAAGGAAPATTAASAAGAATSARQKTKPKFASEDWTEHAVDYIDTHEFAQEALKSHSDTSLIATYERMKDGERITYDEALAVWKAVMIAWNKQQSDDLKRQLPKDEEILAASYSNAHILHRKALHAHLAGLPDEAKAYLLSEKSRNFLKAYPPLGAPDKWYDGNGDDWDRIHYKEVWPKSKLQAELRNRKTQGGVPPPAAPTGTTEEETGAPPLSSP